MDSKQQESNKPLLNVGNINTTVSGGGLQYERKPKVLIGDPKNGYVSGDILDANAVVQIAGSGGVNGGEQHAGGGFIFNKDTGSIKTKDSTSVSSGTSSISFGPNAESTGNYSISFGNDEYTVLLTQNLDDSPIVLISTSFWGRMMFTPDFFVGAKIRKDLTNFDEYYTITKAEFVDYEEKVIEFTLDKPLSATKFENQKFYLYGVTSSGKASVAIGKMAKATASNACSKGIMAYAKGGSSHAEGAHVKAIGSYSFAKGFNTTALGNDGSTAEGFYTIAAGRKSHAGGEMTLSDGYISFAHGGYFTYGIRITGPANSTKYTAVVNLNDDNKGYVPKDFDKLLYGNYIFRSFGKNDISYRPTRIANVIKKSETTYEITTANTLSRDKALDNVLYQTFSTRAASYCSTAFGVNTRSYSSGTFTAGIHTYALNRAETAFGVENLGWIGGKNIQTLFTIGNGPTNDISGGRNAFEVKLNGDVYVTGVGGYDGTNADGVTAHPLQSIIKSIYNQPGVGDNMMLESKDIQVSFTSGSAIGQTNNLITSTIASYVKDLDISDYIKIVTNAVCYGPYKIVVTDSAHNVIYYTAGVGQFDRSEKTIDLTTLTDPKYISITTIKPQYTYVKGVVKTNQSIQDYLFKNSKISDAIYDLQQITIEEGPGWYDGAFVWNNTYKSRRTGFIKVKPGMKFNYVGYGYGNSANYIFLDCRFAHTQIEFGKDFRTGLEVTIPDGVSYVLFQSISVTAEYQPFSVTTKDIFRPHIESLIDEKWLELARKSNILWGKKYVAIGDSFTSPIGTDTITDFGPLTGTPKVYPNIIGNRNNMSVINQGSSGSVLGSYIKNKTYEKIPADVDYVTIWYGINDQGYGITIGTATDKVETWTTEKSGSTGAAFNFIFKWLFTNRPFVHLGVIITDYCEPERRQVIIDCCKRWGVAYLDLYDPTIPMIRTRGNDSIIDPEIKAIRNQHFSSDGANNIHPSNNAHQWQSNIIENFMRGL